MQQVDRSQLDLSPYHSWGDTTTLVERFCGRLKCTCSSAIECWRRGSSRLLRARLTPTSRILLGWGICLACAVTRGRIATEGGGEL